MPKRVSRTPLPPEPSAPPMTLPPRWIATGPGKPTVLRLSSEALLALMVLLYSSDPSGRTWPLLVDIAAEIGSTVKGAGRAVSELIACGIIAEAGVHATLGRTIWQFQATPPTPVKPDRRGK